MLEPSAGEGGRARSLDMAKTRHPRRVAHGARREALGTRRRSDSTCSVGVEGVAKALGKLAGIGDLQPADLVQEVRIFVVCDEDGPHFLSLRYVLSLEVHGSTTRACREVGRPGYSRGRRAALGMSPQRECIADQE